MLRSPRDRHGRFVNYAHTIRTSPVTWLSPRTEDEIAEAVTAAAKWGRRVKVVGAGHSWSPVAAPEDVAVRLDRIRGIVDQGDEWVRVKAGTRLRHVLASLAAQGRTLAVVPSIAQQSISGAVATGTHGSSLQHGSLSSLVIGARLIGGDGIPVEVHGDDERIHGLSVHLGALGVLTELTLRTTPCFDVAESIEQMPVGQVADCLEELGRSAEYVKIWWLPHTPMALVFRYERTGEPGNRFPSADTQRALENWLPRAVLPPLFKWQEYRPGSIPAFNRLSHRWLTKPRRVGPGALMLSTPEPVRHHETEASVPLSRGGEAFACTVDLIRRLMTPVNFILELRYSRGDQIWLSPAHGGDVVHIGACTAMTGTRSDYFELFWQEMRRFEARPHWAKEMDHEAPELRPMYPMFDRFLQLRQSFDPGRFFANTFLDRILGP